MAVRFMAIAFAIVTASCTIFAEDTRLDPWGRGSAAPAAPEPGVREIEVDAGDVAAQPPSEEDAASTSASPAAGAKGGAGGSTCAITLPATSAVGGCGGSSGGVLPGVFEVEPNEAMSGALAAGAVVCGSAAGSDVDRFELFIEGGACVRVTVETTETASTQLSGDGVSVSRTGSGESVVTSGATGRLVITITGASTYTIAVRR